MVVENAFGRLKGRWRCLLKQMDCQLTNVPIIVASCVTLHNICERFGDNCQEEWINNSTVACTQVAGTSISSSYSGQIVSVYLLFLIIVGMVWRLTKRIVGGWFLVMLLWWRWWSNAFNK